MSVKSEHLYRPCVGVALFNHEGKVFVGERIDTPGAWQMPQGGVDPGEDIKKAALRELKEETGTDKATLLRIHDKRIPYETPPALREKLQLIWGKPYIGQLQTWVAMRFTGNDGDIDITADDHPEFSKWQWVALEDTVNLIVPFKKETYLKVIEAFREYSA